MPNHEDFEGSLILEKLAEIDKVSEFFDAVDSDDFKKAEDLMLLAGIDDESIAIVKQQMSEGE